MFLYLQSSNFHAVFLLKSWTHRHMQPVLFWGGGGGCLRSIARIFYPTLARKSRGLAWILLVFCPKRDTWKILGGLQPPPPPPRPRASYTYAVMFTMLSFERISIIWTWSSSSYKWSLMFHILSRNSWKHCDSLCAVWFNINDISNSRTYSYMYIHYDRKFELIVTWRKFTSIHPLCLWTL